MSDEIKKAILFRSNPQCPDRELFKDRRYSLAQPKAQFGFKNEIECVGDGSFICKACSLRVGSYLVDLDNGRQIRVPEWAIEHDPKL